MNRRIRSIAGRPPNTLVRDLRMRKALALIKDQNLNVSEIAHKVGFSTSSYFAKCFEETYGIAPSEMVG